MANLKGLAGLQADMAALASRMVAELPSIARDGVAIAADEIAARAPQLTGALINHLVTTAMQRATSATATVQIDSSAPAGDIHYAIFDEFGTSDTPAKPFFRPGVDAARDRIEAMVVARLAGVIKP